MVNWHDGRLQPAMIHKFSFYYIDPRHDHDRQIWDRDSAPDLDQKLKLESTQQIVDAVKSGL